MRISISTTSIRVEPIKVWSVIIPVGLHSRDVGAQGYVMVAVPVAMTDGLVVRTAAARGWLIDMNGLGVVQVGICGK